jgi:hypothetical protein
MTSVDALFSPLLAKHGLQLHGRYEHLLVDYMFSPEGYNKTWCTLLDVIVPVLAQTTILVQGGSIWLPCWSWVDESISKYKLDDYFTIQVAKCEENPLWEPTDRSESIASGAIGRIFQQTAISPKGFYRLILNRKVTMIDGFRIMQQNVKRHHLPIEVSQVFVELGLLKTEPEEDGSIHSPYTVDLERNDQAKTKIGSGIFTATAKQITLVYNLVEEE